MRLFSQESTKCNPRAQASWQPNYSLRYTHTLLYIIGHSFYFHIQNISHSSLKNKYNWERFRAKTTEEAARSLISIQSKFSTVCRRQCKIWIKSSCFGPTEHHSDEKQSSLHNAAAKQNKKSNLSSTRQPVFMTHFNISNSQTSCAEAIFRDRWWCQTTWCDRLDKRWMISELNKSEAKTSKLTQTS